MLRQSSRARQRNFQPGYAPQSEQAADAMNRFKSKIEGLAALYRELDEAAR